MTPTLSLQFFKIGRCPQTCLVCMHAARQEIRRSEQEWKCKGAVTWGPAGLVWIFLLQQQVLLGDIWDNVLCIITRNNQMIISGEEKDTFRRWKLGSKLIFNNKIKTFTLSRHQPEGQRVKTIGEPAWLRYKCQDWEMWEMWPLRAHSFTEQHRDTKMQDKGQL